MVAALRFLLCGAAVHACAGLTANPNWRPWDDRKRMPVPNTPDAPVLPRIVVLGGTGRIGTAVAEHLIARAAPVVIQLAGRDRTKGDAALAEVRRQRIGRFSQSRFDYLQLDWRDETALAAALEGVLAVVHTAGPYAGETPAVLRAAIAASVPVYVDLSDPVPYLREAKALTAAAEAQGTLALCAGGAFPGLSNVLAMECAGRLGSQVTLLT
jgi:saccharopine dehydrogenase-like NADP-dependent oxidoreductase